MPSTKPYKPFTIDNFGSVRTVDPINGADMEDNEGILVDNFNFTRTGKLTKRLGWYPAAIGITNGAGSNPVSQPTTNPANIVPLRVQRLSPAGTTHRLWFTNVAQTELWSVLLPSPASGNCILNRTPTAQNIGSAEWMIQAATPSAPYQMVLCRSGGLGSGGLVTINSNGVPSAFATSPQGTHITLFKDRIFMINSIHASGQESRVYFSDTAISPGLGYTNWPANNFFDIQPASGEYNVATVIFNDQLIIFKNRSIWVLTADGQPSNWLVRNLHPSIGCIGRGTVQVINGFIYFLSLEGVYRTDGTTFERISEPIDPDLSLYETQTANAVLRRYAWYWDDKYILAIPNVLNTVYTMLVYDLNVQGWSRWMFGGSPTLDISGAVSYYETAPVSLFAGSNISPNIYSMGGPNVTYQDNGSDFMTTWQSKMFDYGDPTSLKRNYMVAADIGYVGVVNNINWVHYTDNKVFTPTGQVRTLTLPPVNTTYEFARKELKFRGVGYSRVFSGQLYYTGPQRLDLYSVTWHNNVKDSIPRPN